MPDIKEKLVELIRHCTSCEECHDADIADHLIANGATIQKWISVEKRLPEPNCRVLVHYSSGLVEVGFWLSTSEHFTLERLHGEVTHWMPLPEAPEEKKGERKI